jgi:hypothetical protein
MENIQDGVGKQLSPAQKQRSMKNMGLRRAHLRSFDGGGRIARGSKAAIAKGLSRHRQRRNEASRGHREANGGTQSSM